MALAIWRGPLHVRAPAVPSAGYLRTSVCGSITSGAFEDVFGARPTSARSSSAGRSTVTPKIPSTDPPRRMALTPPVVMPRGGLGGLAPSARHGQHDRWDLRPKLRSGRRPARVPMRRPPRNEDGSQAVAPGIRVPGDAPWRSVAIERRPRAYYRRKVTTDQGLDRGDRWQLRTPSGSTREEQVGGGRGSPGPRTRDDGAVRTSVVLTVVVGVGVGLLPTRAAATPP